VYLPFIGVSSLPEESFVQITDISAIPTIQTDSVPRQSLAKTIGKSHSVMVDRECFLIRSSLAIYLIYLIPNNFDWTRQHDL